VNHHQPGCENHHQFPQSFRESISLKHSSQDQSMTLLFAGHGLFSLELGWLFFMSASVRRAGCGALLFSTDCVRRQWRRCASVRHCHRRLRACAASLLVHCSRWKTLTNPLISHHRQNWKGWREVVTFVIIKRKLA
jgi:hypothetical protein